MSWCDGGCAGFGRNGERNIIKFSCVVLSLKMPLSSSTWLVLDMGEHDKEWMGCQTVLMFASLGFIQSTCFEPEINGVVRSSRVFRK